MMNPSNAGKSALFFRVPSQVEAPLCTQSRASCSSCVKCLNQKQKKNLKNTITSCQSMNHILLSEFTVCFDIQQKSKWGFGQKDQQRLWELLMIIMYI